jgi:uncharacterized damage-inducible protein DinB
VLGDKVVLGFNQKGLAQLFHLAQSAAKPVADPQLFATLDNILAAVIRAARQVPPERLHWRTPDRERTMKVFCYHILADPNHVLDAISTRKYDGSFKLTYTEAAERFRTMDEVAEFGATTRTRLAEAATRVTTEDLAQSIDGYSGETNGHQLLHQVLSHTAHHLRQLYAMLRLLKIEPTDALKEEDFQGISMPKELW